MEKENTAEVLKLTLYDRVFKPQRIVLENGHTVLRKRSRTPAIVLLLAVAVYLSLKATGFSMSVAINSFPRCWIFWSRYSSRIGSSFLK